MHPTDAPVYAPLAPYKVRPSYIYDKPDRQRRLCLNHFIQDQAGWWRCGGWNWLVLN